MIGSSRKSFEMLSILKTPRLKRIISFTRKLGEANSDIKETWKVLNSALGKRSKTTTIHKLEVNDNDVSDPKKISDKLNSYFCNIA